MSALLFSRTFTCSQPHIVKPLLGDIDNDVGRSRSQPLRSLSASRQVPGSDLAGEVVAVGSGVSRFKAGDQVISHFRPKWLRGAPSREATRESLGGPLQGVFAEYVLLSEQGAIAYPDYLTPAEASTLPVALVTAWVALFTHGDLKPGETVLLQGSGASRCSLCNWRWRMALVCW